MRILMCLVAIAALNAVAQDRPPEADEPPKTFEAYDFPEQAKVTACELSDVQDKNVRLELQGNYSGDEAATLTFELVVSHQNYALGRLELEQKLEPGQGDWKRVVWVKVSEVRRPLRFEANFQRLGSP